MSAKRALFVWSLIAALVLVLAACAPAPAADTGADAPMEGDGEADVVEINWVEWWDGEYSKESLDGLIALFEEKNPGIKVTRTPLGWDSMYDAIVTSAQAETGDYDVLGMEPCCWMSALVKLDALEPLSSYIDGSEGFREGLVSPLAITEWAGDEYSICWYLMPYTYAYDQDVFEEAGLDPPTNWDEMVEVTRALNEGDVVEFGLGAGLNASFYTMYYHWGARLAQLGGDLYDDNNCAIFNSAEGVQAMEDWKELYVNNMLVDGAIGMGQNDLHDLMTAQRVAAYFTGPWVGSAVTLNRADARIAFAPAWTDAETGYGGYQWACSGLAISSNSEHKEEAWKFIEFLLSDEGSIYMSEQTSVTYATKANFARFGEMDNPILKEVPPMLSQDPEHNLFFAPTADFSVHDEWVAAFQEVLDGEREAQDALDAMVELWNQDLPQCQ